jgi:hypothetical protein
MSYSLHIKSLRKHATNLVTTAHGRHVVATRGEKYVIIADNKTDEHSCVTIYIRGKFVGTWGLEPRTKLTIREELKSMYDREATFIFGNPDWHLTDEAKDSACEMYNITAVFEPEGTSITIPIQVCAHPVNTL